MGDSTTASESIRLLRAGLVRIAPDSLERFDLLAMRAGLIGVLQLCETLTNHLQLSESNKMATATLENESAAVDSGGLDGLIDRAKREADVAYRELVLSLVDGESVSATMIHQTAQAAGRSIDDLKADVATGKGRRQALEDIAKSDRLAESLPELDAAREAAGRAVAEKREQQRRELAPLLDASDAADDAFRHARDESQRLRRDSLNTLNQSTGRDTASERAASAFLVNM
jgi:hypothetical protein